MKIAPNKSERAKKKIVSANGKKKDGNEEKKKCYKYRHSKVNSIFQLLKGQNFSVSKKWLCFFFLWMSECVQFRFVSFLKGTFLKSAFESLFFISVRLLSVFFLCLPLLANATQMQRTKRQLQKEIGVRQSDFNT